MAAVTDLSEWEKDGRLFLFTSLTAGSSHIITATSRIETILKANRIPFVAVDTATDEKARKLWGRRGAKKKLPGLVKEGYVIADLEEVEEWNEFGELEENIGPVPASTAPPGVNAVQTTLGNLRMQDAASAAAKPIAPTKVSTPAKSAAVTKTSAATKTSAPPDTDTTPIATPLVGLVGSKPKPLSSLAKSEAAKPETIASAVEDKKESIESAKEEKKLSTPTPEGDVKENTGTHKEQSPVDKRESIDTANDEAATSSTAASSTMSNATPSEPVMAGPVGEAAGETKHKGSSVSSASPEEIKEVEQKIAIPEEHDATDGASTPAPAPTTAPEDDAAPAPAPAADKAKGGLDD